MSSSTITSTSTPTLPSDTEALWKSYVTKNSDHEEGCPLSEAQLVLLGDFHTDKTQAAYRGTIINHYGRDGDIVLFESVQSYEKIALGDVLKELPKCHKKLQCYGWDDKIECDKADRYLDELVKFSKSEKGFGGKTASESLDLMEKESIKFEESAKLRNVSLIRTAKSYLRTLNPGQRVFLIAGSDHLLNQEENYNILPSFKGFKAVLLIPKVKSGTKTEVILNYYDRTDRKNSGK